MFGVSSAFLSSPARLRHNETNEQTIHWLSCTDVVLQPIVALPSRNIFNVPLRPFFQTEFWPLLVEQSRVSVVTLYLNCNLPMKTVNFSKLVFSCSRRWKRRTAANWLNGLLIMHSTLSRLTAAVSKPGESRTSWKMQIQIAESYFVLMLDWKAREIILRERLPHSA